jgi:hypothetical protein
MYKKKNFGLDDSLIEAVRQVKKDNTPEPTVIEEEVEELEEKSLVKKITGYLNRNARKETAKEYLTKRKEKASDKVKDKDYVDPKKLKNSDEYKNADRGGKAKITKSTNASNASYEKDMGNAGKAIQRARKAEKGTFSLLGHTPAGVKTSHGDAAIYHASQDAVKTKKPAAPEKKSTGKPTKALGKMATAEDFSQAEIDFINEKLNTLDIIGGAVSGAATGTVVGFNPIAGAVIGGVAGAMSDYGDDKDKPDPDKAVKVKKKADKSKVVATEEVQINEISDKVLTRYSGKAIKDTDEIRKFQRNFEKKAATEPDLKKKKSILDSTRRLDREASNRGNGIQRAASIISKRSKANEEFSAKELEHFNNILSTKD